MTITILSLAVLTSAIFGIIFRQKANTKLYPIFKPFNHDFDYFDCGYHFHRN
jgi:hypothetical protein